ncbi:MAG: hypothetical protein AABY87_09005 [bacterium]
MIKTYEGFFTDDFKDGLRHLSSLKKQIRKKVDAVLLYPYYNTEPLGKGRWADLRGLRSKRVNRNIRIIFLICEETPHPDCKNEKQRILFLTVGPHDKVYGKP